MTLLSVGRKEESISEVFKAEGTVGMGLDGCTGACQIDKGAEQHSSIDKLPETRRS